jgi:hypothetical protein
VSPESPLKGSGALTGLLVEAVLAAVSLSRDCWIRLVVSCCSASNLRRVGSDILRSGIGFAGLVTGSCWTSGREIGGDNKDGDKVEVGGSLSERWATDVSSDSLGMGSGVRARRGVRVRAVVGVECPERRRLVTAGRASVSAA